MNIDGDYLWDKTGEPDPEIQELEEILGTLGYQPRPLEIPADLQTIPTRGFFSTPRLVIAATLAMALLGLGLWLGLQRSQQPRSPVVAQTPIAPAPGKNPGSRELSNPDQSAKNTGVAMFGVPEQKDKDLSRRHSAGSSVAVNINRSRHTRAGLVRQGQVAVQELREAEAAKDGLMLALRMASAKLNFAQKKTQNINPREPVHNQHKIG